MSEYVTPMMTPFSEFPWCLKFSSWPKNMFMIRLLIMSPVKYTLFWICFPSLLFLPRSSHTTSRSSGNLEFRLPIQSVFLYTFFPYICQSSLSLSVSVCLCLSLYIYSKYILSYIYICIICIYSLTCITLYVKYMLIILWYLSFFTNYVRCLLSPFGLRMGALFQFLKNYI